MASLGQRLGEMAMGETLHSLMGPLGLEEADKGLRPTMGPAQLDHVLYSKGYLQTEPGTFRVHDQASSDHRAISVKLRFREDAA